MSFDLYFCRQNGSTPSISELKEYFSDLPRFRVNDVAAGGVEFWYRNEATGVYCGFSNSPLDAAELEGCGSSGLTFNLNFVRPTFFAYETMPLVEDFSKQFDLLVENPQDETIDKADATSLISSWRTHNAWAIGATKNTPIGEEFELPYMPEASATAWWRYMSVQPTIEEAITDDIFVPSLMILMHPAGPPFQDDGLASRYRAILSPVRIRVCTAREEKVVWKRKKRRVLFHTKRLSRELDPC